MRIIFFILLLICGNSYGNEVESILQQLMDAAREATQQRDQIFEDIERQAYGQKKSSSRIKHRYHHSTTGVSIEFDLPKDPNSELSLDIQEQYIVVKATIVNQIRNSYSSRSYQTIVQLPSGIDFEKPRIEQKKEKLFIHFKKRPLDN